MKATLSIALFVTLTGGFLLPQSLWAQSVFENPQPGSFQSGVGVISGWVCEAERIDIVFNPGTATEETWRAGYRTTRPDTAYTPQGEVICGDTDNGFGLLFNWNRLGDGPAYGQRISRRGGVWAAPPSRSPLLGKNSWKEERPGTM